MSHTWQTVLLMGGGAVLAILGMRIAGRKPKWGRILDVLFALAVIGVAVGIALGDFTRLDAVWPAAVAVDILAHGFFARERKTNAVPAASSPRPAR